MQAALTCDQGPTKQLWPESLELLISFISLLVAFLGVWVLFSWGGGVVRRVWGFCLLDFILFFQLKFAL